MSILQAIIIAIVEGLTEFLPVSSTGHMIIASSFLGIPESDFKELFLISIQLGAIVSVVVLYWKRFFNFSDPKFYLKLLVAFIPAVIAGLLLKHVIEGLLQSNLTVAIALLVGGIVLLFVDRWFKRPVVDKTEQISYKQAFITGIWQCLAMIPGTSRSAATIIGGMQQKFTRRLAAEFSFFLAVPTMFAATAKDLYDYYKKGNVITKDQMQLLAIGNVIAFLVALVAIRFFITYLQKHGFRIFGIYRIIAGVVLLVLIFSGVLK